MQRLRKGHEPRPVRKALLLLFQGACLTKATHCDVENHLKTQLLVILLWNSRVGQRIAFAWILSCGSVGCRPGPQPSKDLTGLGFCFQDGAFPWPARWCWTGKGSQLLCKRAPPRAAEGFHCMAFPFPQKWRPKSNRARHKVYCFNDLPLEMTEHHSHHILLGRCELLSLVHVQGKRD